MKTYLIECLVTQGVSSPAELFKKDTVLLGMHFAIICLSSNTLKIKFKMHGALFIFRNITMEGSKYYEY